jgi:uncharacterized membrane protein
MAAYYHTGLAKGSLISGILSLFIGPITAIPSIFMGHMARSRAKHFPQQYGGAGMALMGLVFSYFSLFVFIFLLVVAYYLQTNGQLEPLLNIVDSSETLSSVSAGIFGQLTVEK